MPTPVRTGKTKNPPFSDGDKERIAWNARGVNSMHSAPATPSSSMFFAPLLFVDAWPQRDGQVAGGKTKNPPLGRLCLQDSAVCGAGQAHTDRLENAVWNGRFRTDERASLHRGGGGPPAATHPRTALCSFLAPLDLSVRQMRCTQRAISTARLSRTTVTCTCPGYSMSCSTRPAISRASRVAWASETFSGCTITRTSRPA